jgi:regulatory protein
MYEVFGASGSSGAEPEVVPEAEVEDGAGRLNRSGTDSGSADSGRAESRRAGRKRAGERTDPAGSGGGFGSAEGFLAGSGGGFGSAGRSPAGAGNRFGAAERFPAGSGGGFGAAEGLPGGLTEPEAKPAPKPRDEAEVAREICLRQLSTRPRTRAELATALTKREISAEVIESVLARYDEVGMIDDAAFAREWVATRHRGRGLARRALADELRRRGVDKETAGAALDELDPETEEATAHALAERKVRVSRGEPDAVFRRVVGMLARKGYPAGLAIRAVKAAMEAQAAEAEELDDGYAEAVDQIDPDALADAVRGDSDPL